VRGPKTWRDTSFCATKAGLVQAIKGHLLRLRLEALGAYQMKRVRPDAKTPGVKSRNIVTREMLDATDAARAALKRNDLAEFGVLPASWAAIEALPDF